MGWNDIRACRERAVKKGKGRLVQFERPAGVEEEEEEEEEEGVVGWVERGEVC
jgi:hypothetical protein